MTLRTLAIYQTIFLVFAGAAVAAELDDSSFGFRLTVPDTFTEFEVGESEPNTLYKYVDREPTPDDPAYVIQIQRLRGVITPTDRMKKSEMPIVEGITSTLQDFTWRGLVLDVIRQTILLPNGDQYIVFGIQYPLSGEAVQLQVGGPSGEEDKLYSLFSQIAGDFQNTKPLHSSSPATTRKLSSSERIQKLFTGIVGLVVTAIVIVFVFRMIKGSFTKKTLKQD